MGQYCNLELAVMPFVLVVLDTLGAPFTTRDTVAVETPASLATSFTVHDRILPLVWAIIICHASTVFPATREELRVELDVPARRRGRLLEM